MLFRLEHDNSGVLGLLLRLDMDRDQRILDLVPQRCLDAITDLVGG